MVAQIDAFNGPRGGQFGNQDSHERLVLTRVTMPAPTEPLHTITTGTQGG
jgi:hypothetical protein